MREKQPPIHPTATETQVKRGSYDAVHSLLHPPAKIQMPSASPGRCLSTVLLECSTGADRTQ